MMVEFPHKLNINNGIVKRYNTVEKGESNWWWVWYDGEYLPTSTVVHKLNDLTDENIKLQAENEVLKSRIKELTSQLTEYWENGVSDKK